MKKVRIILDTNIALHFKQADQIDWYEIVNAKEIFLVITPTFIRELEKHKTQHSLYKLRKRAQRYTSWLSSFLEKDASPQIREHVWLEFIPYEPQIDLQKHRLSSSIPDDQFIAHALEYMENSEIGIWVATSDLGLKMKLKIHGINYFEPPNKFRLSSELDPVERENAQLKEQLAEFKSRLPKLKLCFADNLNRLEFTLSQPEPIEIFVSKKMKPIKAKYPEISVQDESLSSEKIMVQKESGTVQNISLTNRKRKELVDAYNQKLEEYYGEYEKYLYGWWQFHQQSSLVFEIPLLLVNEGTSPANDIDILLKFPETIELYDRKSFYEPPLPPNPPTKPGRINIDNFTGGKILDSFSISRLSNLLPQNSDEPSVSPNERQVKFWIKSLKHNRKQALKSFRVYFRTREEICNFACNYQIYVTEISEPITGELHFVAK